jgi:hypothetical protein
MQSPRRLASSSKCRRSCRATGRRAAAGHPYQPVARFFRPCDVLPQRPSAFGEAAMAKVGALCANESGERTRIHCEEPRHVLEASEPCLIVGDVSAGMISIAIVSHCAVLVSRRCSAGPSRRICLQRADHFRNHVSAGMSNLAAPRTMSSRLTARANALSFIFLHRGDVTPPVMLFPGRTRATAVTNPLSSSTIEGVFERRDAPRQHNPRGKEWPGDFFAPAPCAQPATATR